MAEMKGGVTRFVTRDAKGKEKQHKEEWHVKGTADADGAVIKVAAPRTKKRMRLVEMRGYNLVSEPADEDNYWLVQLERGGYVVAQMECREPYWHAQSKRLNLAHEGQLRVRVKRVGEPQGDLCIDIRVVAQVENEENLDAQKEHRKR